VAAAIARLTRDEAMERLSAAGAPVAPLLTGAEMLDLDHFRARGVLDAGPVRTSAHPPLPGGPVAGLDEHRGEGWRHLTD
jgi:CoA:oxalate CoA-transferase